MNRSRSGAGSWSAGSPGSGSRASRWAIVEVAAPRDDYPSAGYEVAAWVDDRRPRASARSRFFWVDRRGRLAAALQPYDLLRARSSSTPPSSGPTCSSTLRAGDADPPAALHPDRRGGAPLRDAAAGSCMPLVQRAGARWRPSGGARTASTERLRRRPRHVPARAPARDGRDRRLARRQPGARDGGRASAARAEAERLRDELGRRVDLLDAANRCARALGSSLELERGVRRVHPRAARARPVRPHGDRARRGREPRT